MRDAGSAYYVVHVTATAMVTPTFFGLGAELLFPNHPGWALDALAAWKALAAIGLLMFAGVYLETREKHRWLDKAILLFVGGLDPLHRFRAIHADRLHHSAGAHGGGAE